MRTDLCVLSLAGLLVGTAQAQEPLVLADRGESDFVVAVAADAPPSTRHAVAELITFFRQMTGVELPVVSDREPMGPHEIIVGDNAHLRGLGVDIAADGLGQEGYLLRTAGPHLVIAGGEPRGTLYGVYGLLHDHLGCRWFTSTVSRIPRRGRVAIGPLNERKVPILEYREPFTTECFDGDWCARNRVNSSTGRLQEKHGGKITYYGFVHTFNSLVPPEEFYDQHPEYFAEVNGKRLKDHTQLCCTNEEVIRIVTERVRQRMREHPEAMVFSVSQNDWGNYCQCARCAALAQEEDSQAGPLLHLVNRVAEGVADEFPDKAIDTLAYQWSRKPPKSIRPLPNVIVRLCSIECCFSHPLETCDSPANQAFVRDIEGWARIGNRLWVWDYCTSFPHYLLPFPNQRVRDDNIRFFIRNNVRGIFEQDTYNTLGSELAELGGYMTARFLWDPDYGEDRAMDEFLEGVYQQAAPFIRQWIDLLHDRVERQNIHVNIWVGPNGPHLTNELLEEAHRLFARAEQAVADQPEVRERVQIARASVDYALFERARMGLSRNQSVDHAGFRILPDPVLAERFEPFLAAVRASGMTRLSEWRDTDFGEYREGLRPLAEARELEPLATVQAPGLTPGLTCLYYEGSWERLPDFASLQPAQAGHAEAIHLEPRARDERFALQFVGYLRAPRDGVYTFHLGSDDGSRLLIGTQVIVDHDGTHSMSEKTGHAALRAGLHPITLQYFQGAGDLGLELSWEGPGIDRQPLPAGALNRQPD